MTPRVAFITSAAKGLGHATVKSLALAGWDICFTYGNSTQEAAALATFVRDAGRRVLALPVHLLSQSEVVAAVERCVAELGRADALIHNFGPFIFERKLLSEYTDEMWHNMVDGNLTNFFWAYRAVVAGMRQRAFGRIVSVGYDGAGSAVGWRFRSAYAAAKAGLAALTRSIALEERQNGITANMVCPGDIRGAHKMEMVADVSAPDRPLGRPPVGEDIGRLIAFLCSDDSGELNGTVTSVTGGHDALAFDDQKYPIPEPGRFAVGDAVWAHPWATRAVVRAVEPLLHQHTLYHVDDGHRTAPFTAFQLAAITDLDA